MHIQQVIGSGKRSLVMVLAVTLFWFGGVSPATAQLSALTKSATTEEAALPPPPTDALGRLTPRGAVTGFLDAVGHDDYIKAAEYLTLDAIPKNRRAQAGATLAENLQTLLDHSGKIVPNAMLSADAAGHLNDDLPPTEENIGTVTIAEEKVNLILTQATNAEGAAIWLLSADTVAKIPEDAAAVADIIAPINRFLPAVTVQTKLAGVPVGHWAAIIFIALLSYGVAWLLTFAFTSTLRKLWRKACEKRTADIIDALSLPIRIYMAVIFFVMAGQHMGISIVVRQYFSQITVAVAWVAIVLLCSGLINVFMGILERRMMRKGNVGGLSAILFFRRGLKFAVIAVALFMVLGSLGVDVTTGLAAIGIGGIALALGAQKTVENFVGSLTLVFDQPVRVGDFCKVGDTLGTVEQIGMRSTRIRTLDRTLVTIPNGDFSALKIENYAHRDRFRFLHTFGVRFETSPDQLRFLLVEIRSILYAHPKVDPDPARVRFVGFGRDALNIEILAYVNALDYNQYLEVQEDIFLRIMDVMAKSGTDFAFPSQTLYMARATELSADKRAAAEAQVQAWRDADDLQLPVFDFEKINKIKNSIEYPSPGSSTARDRNKSQGG